MKAKEWDDVGPQKECLLRIKWIGHGEAEWVHFQWRSVDGEYDEEGCILGNPDEYYCDGIDLSVSDYGDGYEASHHFIVTHWLELEDIEL